MRIEIDWSEVVAIREIGRPADRQQELLMRGGHVIRVDMLFQEASDHMKEAKKYLLEWKYRQ